MTAICLTMIVKNEAHIVREALESVRRYLADYVIVDTGSTDDTIAVIQEFFTTHGIPGHILERPWRNFGENRTEALQLARELSASEYLWMMDADDRLVGKPEIGSLDRDVYKLRLGPHIEQWRYHLFKRSARWRYVGVLHEYAACDKRDFSSGYIRGEYYLEARTLGDRSRDPNKYVKDARVLEQALCDDPQNARYVFYLAQCYFDAGVPARALDEYRRRSAMGGWDQEVFYSRYRVAQCLEQLDRPQEEVRAAYLECFQCHPLRAEPLVAVASQQRRELNFPLAYEYARRAAEVPRPGLEALYVEPDVYGYRARDEQSIAAFYLGKYDEAFRLGNELLRFAPLPDDERARIEANRDFCVPHLRDRFLRHDDALVRRLASRPDALVTLTITSCKRLELLIRTVDSFFNACTDVDRIARWICIDDNSSEPDRREMERQFPFFEFVWKEPRDKGHPRSMNILRDMVQTPYWLHLEDDWQFFEPLPYIGQALDILQADPALGQVLFNRHYAEGLEDRLLVGGVAKRTPTGQRYLEHLYLPTGSLAQDQFWREHPGSRSYVWWPHYSLRPSLLRMDLIRNLGPYREESNFEFEFATRYAARGFRSAFFDTICSLHTGRRTSERLAGDPNAYELNQTVQFEERPVRIKLLANWCTSEALCARWDKMSRGDCRWGRVELTWEDRDVDYYAIFNAPPAGALFVPDRTIVFQMEPRSSIEQLPAAWREPDRARFLQVRSHDFFLNVSEWHLGKTYEELSRTPIEKTRLLSTVTSSLELLPGHKRRVNFIRYLERRGVPIDVFGRSNDAGFQNYCGALPQDRKEGGLFPYKYTFAAENCAKQNYFTEKLVDAILSECLCFYWGCPNLGEYIDPRAYIRVDLDDFEAAAKAIEAAIAKGEWERRLEFIRAEKRKILDEYQVFPTLERIITDARSHLWQKARRLRLERRPVSEVAQAYEKAFREDPTRAEPLWELAEYVVDHETKCRVLERMTHLPIPARGGCKSSLYEWRMLDAYSMALYYAARYEESFAAYDELLQRAVLPASERPRVEANLQFTLAKLPLPDIVVINLDRRPDRLARFRQQAEREGLRTWRRVAAMDGRELVLDEPIRHLFRGNAFDNRRTVIGCALSHLQVWRTLEQPTLVFEDDVDLSPAFLSKLHSVLRQAGGLEGGWDIILLGWLPWSALQAAPPRPVGHPRLAEMRWEEFMGGSFAYLLSPNGAANLCQRVLAWGVQEPIDWFIMRQADGLRAYRSVIPIAWSDCARTDRRTDSDIQYDWEPLRTAGAMQ